MFKRTTALATLLFAIPAFAQDLASEVQTDYDEHLGALFDAGAVVRRALGATPVQVLERRIERCVAHLDQR